LGCPDEVEVLEGNGLKHQFVALLRFRMCQRRLRIAQKISTEFVAGGACSCLSVC
jgi:hypothetical protein